MSEKTPFDKFMEMDPKERQALLLRMGVGKQPKRLCPKCNPPFEKALGRPPISEDEAKIADAMPAIEMVIRGSIFLKPGLPSDIYICPKCGFIEFWEHPTEMKKI